MLKLVRGEIYRLFHKKSMAVYFGALTILYFFLAFIRSGGFSTESVVKDAMTLFNFSSVLAGGFFFSAIYTDDLNSKNLTVLVGYGMSKIQIVLAKLLLSVLFCTVFFGLFPLFHAAIYALLGYAATANQMTLLYAASVKFLLMTLAYMTMSSIVVYASQRTTFAIVTYVLLGFGVIKTIFTIAGNVFELNIYNHILSGITDRMIEGIISGNSFVLPLIEYVMYMIIAVVLSAIAFQKKEMEF